jgi:predicted phosphate transport protein (TIGR00153 family)
MKADNVIRWFMPKEERFQDLLAQSAQNLLRGARLFAEIANATTLEQRRVKTVQLKAIEHDGDQVTRRIFEALNSTFITPLDREDIRSLGGDLDDILDYLESAAQYLTLFELSDSPEGLRRFSEILVEMATEVERTLGLIWDLNNVKLIQEGIVRVSELENQGDSLYATVIADLFRKDSRKPVEIMKWKEVYDGLEEACDACKDFTHIVGNVVIKNA